MKALFEPEMERAVDWRVPPARPAYPTLEQMIWLQWERWFKSPSFTDATEGKPSFTDAAEGKPSFTDATEGKPSFTDATEGKPSFTDATEGKPSFTDAAEGKPSFTDAAEGKGARQKKPPDSFKNQAASHSH